ncbi:MAG TPA: DPP IV N-terminal domain-containing protein [Kofleriaceae bacterium]|nr:DPP IV N-terminal domain-containing protein [Kofleriaceae bacterium]
MFAVRRHLGCCALVLVIAGLGCRGESSRAGGAAGGSGSAAPAEEKLAWPAIDEPSLVALQATERFELGAPVPLAITPDGTVLFRRSKPRDRTADLYQLDAAGKTTLLASAAALLAGPAPGPPGAASTGNSGPGSASAPASGTMAGSAGGSAPPAATGAIDAGAGIETISVSDDGSRVLVPLAGRLFLIERAAGTTRELAIGPHHDPQLSPDGKRVAFVRDGDLWVQAIGEPQPTRIAQHPEHDDARAYATPDAIARAFGRDRGFWWSPDSQAIAFERRDARAVEPQHVADPRHPEAAPAMTRVPRPGKPLATVDLGIASVHGGAPRWVTWELARYPYLARVTWPAKGPLTLIVVGREQTVAAVVAVDAATGAARPILVDKDPAWINIAPDAVTWLPDGSGFLWLTEANGAWSLEHHAADGAHLGSVVTADFGVRRVAGISPDGQGIVIEGAADPREQHVWRVRLAGGAPVALSSDGGVHTALAGHGVVVINSHERAGGRVTTVLRADGSRTPLPSVADHPPARPTTKIEEVLADDHMQYTAITRPRAFDPKVRYPVVLRLGASLDGKDVLDALDTYLLDQWYADAGFIVVRSDGRGTPGRDRMWQRAIAGDALTIPMNDQIRALKRLGAQYPELDLARVGALGGEFGGYLATLGALIHRDVFAAAVAVSPITDWELVDAASSERVMKTPATNSEGYRRASALTYADQLTRPLLLMPRIPGSRVSPTHTFALIDALSAAGKHAEFATLPDQADAAHRIAATRLVVEFFRRQLGPPVRPAVMPAARDEDEEEERERAERRGSDHGDRDRGDKGHR